MVRTASEPTATRTRSHPGRIRTKFLQSRSPIRVALTTFADKPLATRGSSPLAPRLAGPPRVARQCTDRLSGAGGSSGVRAGLVALGILLILAAVALAVDFRYVQMQCD